MPIYYADVAGMFLHETEAAHIELFANEVQFHFKNSPNGIQQFNLKIEGGQLIGIMGSSGVGKSTLFNILNGTIIPQQGSITINGFDLSKESRKLRGIIGYVPQDDLLIEELTVFQNLYYNARLCFSGLGEPQIVSRVNKMISDLDLDEISTLTVGNSLNKFISGGQRKRLNIALELIREPAILFVDEPTSGLSSMDSETVMLLLKEQTAKGKLVVVNIHQPSSDVYKLFDKLLILDKGGRMIYNGNPIDAIGYFKRKSHHVNPDENECPECGNVNPEQILQIVEARMVNEVGQFTKQRKVVPEEWYAHYREHLESSYGESVDLMELPQNYFKLPGLCSQFLVFFMRNLRAKLTNKQYIVINLLQAPLLAFILAYATKYAVGTDTDPYFYVFAENKNFPGFLFMGVIVALFFGLTVSAEEIIKDRKILQRESFLRLSRWSYINSKFSFLLLLSAFQSIVYVLISNWVLQVHDMTLAYWSILFSISVCANIIGLNISSALDSVVAIYILIPLIIIPQLLLSGAMISFENLHKRIGSSLVVPIIGDLMVSRWGYEALTVYSFKENSFEKNFFDAELDISDASFKTIYLLPQLKSMVDECQTNLVLGKELRNASILNIVWAEMANLNEQCKEIPPLNITVLKNEKFGEQVATKTIAQIGILADYFTKNKNKATRQKEEIYANLVKKIGKDGVYNLQTTHHNKALSAILENKFEIKKIVEEDGRLVQTKDHIFRRPATSYGRAHFYASYKKLGGCKIDTLVFNLGAIWLMITLFYLMLWHNTIRRIIDYITLTKLKWRQRTKSTHNVV
jgi:ABC-type multidrug transport system ATPase subunit